MDASLTLAGRLATARLKDPRGAGALDALAVTAHAVAAWLTFTVASGTWMFVLRRADPSSVFDPLADPTFIQIAADTYVGLAAIACALLILPILSLGGAAARLGARGRSRRLASLRLVGMTGGQVIRMSVVESLVQASVGILLGALAWLATVPVLGLNPGALVVGLVFAGVIGFGALMVNLFAPLLFEAVARLAVRTNSPSRLVAMRRIVADPRAAWRNVSSLALTGFAAGMVAPLPLVADEFGGQDAVNSMLLSDLNTGALLTLGIAIIVGAASTALTQASDVVDRADEIVALDRMGVPRTLDASARRHQVALPLVLTLLLSTSLGVLAGAPFMALAPDTIRLTANSGLFIGLTILGALAVSLLAAESTRPLRTRVLGQQVRRND